VARIAFISDIHLDRNGEVVIQAIAQTVQLAKAELLVIPGDLSCGSSACLESINKLEAACKLPVYFVPGNHDIWFMRENDIPATAESYPTDSHQELSRLHADKRCLSTHILALDNDWKIGGSMGWFDYSFGNRQFSVTDFSRMTYERQQWQDKLRSRWQMDHPALALHLLKELQQLLGSELQKTIVVTHVVPHQQFTIPEDYGNWRYFNAFLGSAQYGEYSMSGFAPLHVFGHVHWRGESRIGNTTFMVQSLGYKHEWKQNDVLQEVKKCLAVVDTTRRTITHEQKPQREF